MQQIALPNKSEVKYSSHFAPTEVDVRELLALSLPHRSSNNMHIYSPDVDILSELHNLVAGFILSRVRCLPSCGRVFLPKIFRRNKEDFILWRRDTVALGRESLTAGRPSAESHERDSLRPSCVSAEEGGNNSRASGTSSNVFSGENPVESGADGGRHTSIYKDHGFSPPVPSDSGGFVANQGDPKRQATGVFGDRQRPELSSRGEQGGEDSSAWDSVAADASLVGVYCLT